MIRPEGATFGLELGSAAIALSLAWGCGGARGEVPTKSPENPEKAAPSATAALSFPLVGTPTSVETELRRVEAARGLVALRPVEGRQVSGADLTEHLRRVFVEETPQQELRGSEDTLRLLGVVPADFDLERQTLAQLRGFLMGLYEPRQNVLYLRGELASGERRFTLFHELVHALQHQHFGLEEFVGHHEGAADRISALLAVVEGDAVYHGTKAWLASKGESIEGREMFDILRIQAELAAPEDPEAQAELEKNPTPRFIEQASVVQYLDGLRFVMEVLARGGREELDAVLRDPPKTTEQLLHAEKYALREAPLRLPKVVLPDALGPGFSRLSGEAVGEQGLRLVLAEYGHGDPARTRDVTRAAAGWGNDEAAIYVRDSTSLLVWTLRFDSEADAREAAPLLLQSEQAPIRGQQGTCVDASSPSGANLGSRLLLSSGDTLRLIAGPYDRDARPDPSVRLETSCADWAGQY